MKNKKKIAQRMRTLDANLSWFGYSILEAMEKAGIGISNEVQKELRKKRLKKAKIAIFCGPGNKGGDGLVAARYLAKTGNPISVFLVAEPKTAEARENFNRLKKIKNPKIVIKKIETAHALVRELHSGKSFDVLMDALLGTGLIGPLRPQYNEIIFWLNRQPGFKVAIDMPTGYPGPSYFHDDLTISMHVSKKRGAKVVDIGIPKKLEHYVGPGQVKLLKLNRGQHKGQNGVLTVIGGSKKYHGAPFYAIEAAAPFVDLIFFHSPEKDNLTLLKMKSKSNAFITIELQKDLGAAVEKSDVILMGNGLEENTPNKTRVKRLLKRFPKKKFVLDAGAMMMADKRLFFNRAILTPHAGEFKRCFKMEATANNAQKMARTYRCIILLKGPKVDIITDGKEVYRNFTGNSGMTRGGTGDVLAGLVAALATQNELLRAAQAGAFLNGMAGDLAARKHRAFTADDVAGALPDALEFAMGTGHLLLKKLNGRIQKRVSVLKKETAIKNAY